MKSKDKTKVKRFSSFDGLNIPERLKASPYFQRILSLSSSDLFHFLLNCLSGYGYSKVYSLDVPKEGYIFAKGELPVCLCAHIDKVPHYKAVKKIHKVALLDPDGTVKDVHLSSKQGIGGDDRCGVFAILSMLRFGFRPSVLFCDGEEIGCLGSHRFTNDFPKEFLSDVNAFIQIDRRGNSDCVRYSDENDALTKAIEPFGFLHAWGTCTDISVLMPHFGISGVNLSSGYYHEHNAYLEYVSMSDVSSLLDRLKRILSECDFSTRYSYVPRSYSAYSYGTSYYPSHRYSKSSFHDDGFFKFGDGKEPEKHRQLNLLSDPNFKADDVSRCTCCGELAFDDEMVEIDHDLYDFVCPDCAEHFLQRGWYKCSCCGNLCRRHGDSNDASFVDDACPFCGCLPNEEF